MRTFLAADYCMLNQIHDFFCFGKNHFCGIHFSVHSGNGICGRFYAASLQFDFFVQAFNRADYFLDGGRGFRYAGSLIESLLHYAVYMRTNLIDRGGCFCHVGSQIVSD